MLNFFRKKRKILADDNKLLKYLRYAIGEIVLVMIGILLALQVNIWNESRKQNKIGLNVLVKLEKEFIENQNILKEIIPLHNRTLYSSNKLLDIISPHFNQNKVDSLGYYVNDLIFVPKYTPNNSILNSVIASGNINHINNEDIIYKITNWKGKIEEYNYWITIVSSISIDLIIPYTINKFPLKNMNSIMLDPSKFYDKNNLSKFEFDQNKFLTSMKFESLVEQRRLISIQLKMKVNDIYSEQDEIISLIKKELKKN